MGDPAMVHRAMIILLGVAGLTGCAGGPFYRYTNWTEVRNASRETLFIDADAFAELYSYDSAAIEVAPGSDAALMLSSTGHRPPATARASIAGRVGRPGLTLRTGP